MLSMRGCWSDLGIAPGGIEAFLGDRWIVVKVNQVMRHAGMLWLAYCDWVQDRRALERAGVRFVGRRSRGVQRKRIIDLRFVIVGITLSQLFHGLGVSMHARTMIDLVVIGVHGAERIEVVALALSLGADALSLGDRGSTLGEILRRRRRVRIPQQAYCDAPIGDPAFRICLQHLLEHSL